jgi:inorganic pyrophosphatase
MRVYLCRAPSGLFAGNRRVNKSAGRQTDRKSPRNHAQHHPFISYKMKTLLTGFALVIIFACSNQDRGENTAVKTTDYLRDIAAFASDSLVNVVIEIPAGTSEKWELNKENGRLEWEQLTPGSFRVIDYLAYPANYGFVPQTLLPETTGGDGDPVDVFVLGSAIARERIVTVRIVGMIHLLDNEESDPKLLAVNTDEAGLDINSFEMLKNKYPGIIEIIRIWLLNYKGPDKINILSVNDETDALRYLKKAHRNYIDHKTK